MNIQCLNTWIIAALISLASFSVHAEIVVITNATNPVATLTRKQVIDLYMGRQINFPDGSPALPIDQALDSEIRARYYQALVGKSVAEINAYWARLLFTGISSPPRVLPTPEAVLQTVSNNPQALAYMDASFIKQQSDVNIKIVFRLDD